MHIWDLHELHISLLYPRASKKHILSNGGLEDQYVFMPHWGSRDDILSLKLVLHMRREQELGTWAVFVLLWLNTDTEAMYFPLPKW